MSTSATRIIPLFVYGTLLNASKYPIARELRRRSQFIGSGFFTGRLYDLGTYPGAVYNACATTFVYGEIYSFRELDAENLLLMLDDYEGDEYVRVVVPVQTEHGFVNCWTYVFNQPTTTFPCIASGRYFG